MNCMEELLKQRKVELQKWKDELQEKVHLLMQELRDYNHEMSTPPN